MKCEEPHYLLVIQDDTAEITPTSDEARKVLVDTANRVARGRWQLDDGRVVLAHDSALTERIIISLVETGFEVARVTEEDGEEVRHYYQSPYDVTSG